MDARTRLLLASLIILCVSSFGAFASGTYAVSAELLRDGKSFAAPSVVVRNGEPATLHVSGCDEFTLTLTVNGLNAEKIEVATSVDSRHGSLAPTVVVEPGVPATVTVGDLGLRLTVNRRGT